MVVNNKIVRPMASCHKVMKPLTFKVKSAAKLSYLLFPIGGAIERAPLNEILYLSIALYALSNFLSSRNLNLFTI